GAGRGVHPGHDRRRHRHDRVDRGDPRGDRGDGRGDARPRAHPGGPGPPPGAGRSPNAPPRLPPAPPPPALTPSTHLNCRASEPIRRRHATVDRTNRPEPPTVAPASPYGTVTRQLTERTGRNHQLSRQ